MRLGHFRFLPIFAVFGCALTGPEPFAPTQSPPAAPTSPDRPVVSVPAPEHRGPTSPGPARSLPIRTTSRPTSPSIADGASLLRQAAQDLDAGDDHAALQRLVQYVRAFPEHLSMRAHLAELQIKLGLYDEARGQLEQYLADAPVHGEAAQHRLHCHTRLVELAVARGDLYAECLHRGGGLLTLAQQLARHDPDAPEVQRILFEAIAELNKAASARGDEPRPHLWLAQCWTQLGQTQPAREHRAKARRLALTGDLSDAELTLLQLESSSNYAPW